MRSQVLLALLSLSWICVAVAQVSYDDCCLKYVKRMRPVTQRHVVRYRVQETDGGCNIPAVIFFVSRRKQMFCTDPREKWVQDLRKKVDKRMKRTKILFQQQLSNRD